MNQSITPRHRQLHHEIIIAGYGGQGVLKMGHTLAEAAMIENYEVVSTPAYGPEMRGGPAFCTVIVSSSPIGSPVVAKADSAIIMDRPSLTKYQNWVRPDGVLLINSSLVDPDLARADIACYAIRANHLAEELGEAQAANMVMLGAFLRLTGFMAPDAVVKALEHVLPERRRHLIPINARALAVGEKAMAKLLASPAVAYGG